MRFSAHFAACVLILILTPRLLLAQQAINWIGRIEFKSGQYGYHFDQQGAVLGEGFLTSKGIKSGSELAFSGGIQYQFSRKFALELGMGFREVDMTYHDARFQNKYSFYPEIERFYNLNGIYTYGGNMNIAEWYWAPYLSAYYFLHSKNNIRPYLNVGASYNYFWQKAATISGSYIYPSSGAELRSVVTYAPQYASAFTELGLAFEGGSKYNPSWYIGLRTTFSGKMASSDYYNIKSDVIDYTDHVSMTGTSWGIVVRVSGLLEDLSNPHLKSSRARRKGAEYKSKRRSKKPTQNLKINSINNQ
jgi:hypothetical protein